MPLYSALMRFKAYAPLLLGVVIVLVTRAPSMEDELNHLQFSVAAWGYSRLNINVFTSAGFYIFVTALVCYLFRSQQANAAKDFVIASKRSRASLSTLAVGSATVYLLVDTGADCTTPDVCLRVEEPTPTLVCIRLSRFWEAWLSAKVCRAIFCSHACRSPWLRCSVFLSWCSSAS